MKREIIIEHFNSWLSEIDNGDDDAVCYLTSEDAETIKAAIEEIKNGFQGSCE